jgi:hypothetical protein
MTIRITPVPPRGGAISGRDGKFTEPWSGWFRNLYNLLQTSPSTTVTLAKITPGGANGSLTIVNGVVTSVTAPT